ncbi:hypothetical protein [Mucilaginibacter sp. UYCu711]|uniref:hypothetical protein n=1 Tax=Mucilaginibacter sp. UYCu711 TaxID=3156339 RepID=UPI003D1A71EF
MMQLEVFLGVLNLIEKKNIEWFKNRKGILDSQDHDLLINHLEIMKENHNVTFSFRSDSELPKDIREQCTKVYEAFFPNTYF